MKVVEIIQFAPPKLLSTILLSKLIYIYINGVILKFVSHFAVLIF